MSLDPKFLREHYAALSDEALLAVKRGELLDAARQCYDQELRERRIQVTAEPGTGDTATPDWVREAVEVYSAMAGTVEPLMSKARAPPWKPQEFPAS